MKFNVNLSISNNKANVTLEGMMDEDMDLSSVQNVSETEMVFNFDKVTGINSCGIRDWIDFLNFFSSAEKIIYEKCPQVIIEQMNMVKGFIPEKGEIKSFYAPFFCESCDSEEKVLLNTEDVKKEGVPENLSCKQCNASPMEFDALPNQYFHFIK